MKSCDRHATACVTKPVDLDEIANIVNSIDAFWLPVVRLPGDERMKKWDSGAYDEDDGEER